jgi:hypothetical protein
MGLVELFGRRRSVRILDRPDAFHLLRGLLFDMQHPITEPCTVCGNAELASAAKRLEAIIQRIENEGRPHG